MIRTSRKQRLVILGVSTALAAGGALLPTSAFAAPANSHTGAVISTHGDHGKNHHGNKGDGKKKGNKRKGNRARDIENMPGCKFVSKKVYCEFKPETKPETKPDFKDPETGADTRGKVPSGL
ncbi:hypothetical protein OG859_39070 [Streptomyces sp. NBC_00048]|uniref:hypothetical protein n=1 Tax=Streptomyces sp. NBC_00048 TaxID=2975628 RepID=UPI00324820E7